jgi:hypothetical protein
MLASLAAAAWGLTAPTARARGPIEIMPLSDVRPGMKGHAVTVFSGTQSDKFEIEVIDLVPDYSAGMDAILFRATDPRLEHSGIVGGMSGSPIFIDGKLVGALAYGYRFNKDPIGGITPIEAMLEIDKLPYRPDVLPRAQGRAPGTHAAWADVMLGLGTDPRPARHRPSKLDGIVAGGDGFAALGAPLNVAGFGPRASHYLGETLGLVPARGSGGSALTTAPDGAPIKPTTPKAWAPGDSVSVVLVGGDLSAAPNGTVTWVGGKSGERLLAFGHPMAGNGPNELPIADARVHVIIPSVERSVKIASPLAVQGSMVQDRNPAIALRTDVEARTIPVITEIIPADPDMPPTRYASFVADAPALTPPLATSLMLQALDESSSDAVEVTVEMTHRIDVETKRGARTLEFTEETWFPQGVVPGPLARSRAYIAMFAALDNDFEYGRIRRIEQRAKVKFGAPVELIESLAVVQEEIRAGDVIDVDVRLKTPRGEHRTLRVGLRIPDDIADEEVVIQVSGGAWSRPPRPPAKTLDALLDNLTAGHPSRSLVATISRGDEGLATEAGLMPELPRSVLETLSPSGLTRSALRIKKSARRVIETPTFIEGDQQIRVTILPKSRLQSP